MGMQLGRTAVQAGQEYVEKNFGSFWLPMRSIKGSFNVSNGYVVKKLGLLVVPWRHRGWNRRVLGGEGEGNGEYVPVNKVFVLILLCRFQLHGMHPLGKTSTRQTCISLRWLL